MSSIMRWRKGEIGLIIGELLSTGLHNERAILADRRLPTDHPSPIEIVDGLQLPRQPQTKALSKSTFSIELTDTRHTLPTAERFSASGLME
jgi:hypothetical protein